eukprot:Awhi_evm1s1232
MHFARHITDDVRRFGLVIGYWCFYFERVNASMVALKQMIKAAGMKKMVPSVIQNLKDGPENMLGNIVISLYGFFENNGDTVVENHNVQASLLRFDRSDLNVSSAGDIGAFDLKYLDMRDMYNGFLKKLQSFNLRQKIPQGLVYSLYGEKPNSRRFKEEVAYQWKEGLWTMANTFFTNWNKHQVGLGLPVTSIKLGFSSKIEIYSRARIGFLDINSTLTSNLAASFVIALQLESNVDLLEYNCYFEPYLAQVQFFFSIPVTNNGVTRIHDFAYVRFCYQEQDENKKKKLKHPWDSTAVDTFWIWEDGTFFRYENNVVPMT